MAESYITSNNVMQELFLSKDRTPQTWAELAALVREKIRKLEHVADAFERYRDEGEPFIAGAAIPDDHQSGNR